MYIIFIINVSLIGTAGRSILCAGGVCRDTRWDGDETRWMGTEKHTYTVE